MHVYETSPTESHPVYHPYWQHTFISALFYSNSADFHPHQHPPFFPSGIFPSFLKTFSGGFFCFNLLNSVAALHQPSVNMPCREYVVKLSHPGRKAAEIMTKAAAVCFHQPSCCISPPQNAINTLLRVGSSSSVSPVCRCCICWGRCLCPWPCSSTVTACGTCWDPACSLWASWR